MANSARIDELRKKFDENPRRYFAPLANEYRKAGDQEQAIFICQEYLPQQPGHMSGHIVYAQALFELGRFDEAKAVFETALTLDPENLIALRHLGDIARHAGDYAAARQWYQRVLEADPRNEEIAQLMLSLLGNESAAPASPAIDHNAPTPLNTPAVAEPAIAEQQSEPSAAVEDVGGFSVEKSPDEAELAPVAIDEPPPVPEPAAIDAMVETGEQPPPLPVTPAANASEDLMDLDEFNIGGLAASSESAVTEEQSVAAPVDAQEHAAEPPDLGFNLGEEEGPFEADPFAIAAQPPVPSLEPEPVISETPEPEIELAADLVIGLPSDAPPIVVEEAVHEDVAAETVGGLETFDEGLSAAASVAAPALDIVPFDATPLSTAAVPSAPIDGGHDGREAPAEEAFVTETMAELYLRQGHLESALDIYRKLVDARPEDEALRERMHAVEARVYGTPASIDEPVAAPVAAGPTIREFLQSLVRPHASPAEASAAPAEEVVPPETAYEESESHAPEPISDGQWSAAADGSEDVEQGESTDDSPPIDVPRPTPAATETVSGSIDALFSGAEASSPDSSAASTLAEAFAPEGPETAPLHGVPAHRASSELSLDHVFKTGTPPRGESADAFSFDQFFSEEMTQASAPSEVEPGAAPREAPDDIAQFNAWLNGLKKT